MHKTSSAYLKELYKGDIKWFPFNAKTLRYARKNDKIIFIHIGYAGNVRAREDAYKLFGDKSVIETINENFIPIAIDLEDVPEAMLIGMDLLVLSEQHYSIPINIFSLPSARPFTSLSGISPDEFMALAQNIIFSFKHKRQLLEKAGNYTAARLKGSSIVPEREKPYPVADKLLHVYVRSWMMKYTSGRVNRRQTPYTINSRYYIFLLKYAHHYKKSDKMAFLFNALDKLYYSHMFDSIEGGVFSQAVNNSFSEPLYEKQFSENIQTAVLYAFAYKYHRKPHYKEAAIRIIDFIENSLKAEKGGYITSISIRGSIEDSLYYRLSLNELEKIFKEGHKTVAYSLGMDLNADPNLFQRICHTQVYEELGENIKEKLLKLRKNKSRELLKDNRVITAYNCMFATSLCLISNIIKEKRRDYISTAEKIVGHILSERNTGNLKLYRYISANKTEHQSAQLLDYSFFLNALLNIYKNTRKAQYDKLISQYTAYILLNYYRAYNGMFSKTDKAENITPFKRESIIDYVRYSANSVMARNLLMLYKMRKDDFYITAFKQQLYNVSSQLVGTGPLMVGWALQILNFLSDRSDYD